MWRTRAVLDLLHEEIAGLKRQVPREEEAARRRELDRARRRARWVIGLDWTALAVLLAMQEAGPFVSLGRTEQTAFSLAVLAVAVHSGFRLGQLEKLSAVARAAAGLERRDPEP